MNKQYKNENLLIKIASYILSIPKVWRQSFFWLIMFTLAILGWIKLLF